ncbi:MAG: hypothetical protein HY241_13150 [Actinobacteria bacterium]|nr:hypothetical protein [Actinomycetota bacterium]
MDDHDDPYRRCGLRANPFAHGDGGPQDAAGWVDRGLPAAAEPGRHRLVQVIGVKGAGKTSTLQRWRAVAPGPWRYVPPGIQRLRPLPVAPLVYWDEADRAPAALRWWGWRAAARSGATIVAGTHVDLGAEAQAAGLAVHSVVLCTITVEELTVWAAQRFAGVSAEPGWVLPKHVAADVAACAGASWRVAGDLLHAWVAREVAARDASGG